MANQAFRPFEVQVPIPVQTYDIDFVGIVSNISYIRWLEDLRIKILSEYFPLEKLLELGLAPVLMETHIVYKRPVKILDKLVGCMWVGELDALRWRLDAEFLKDGKLAAKAEQSGVFITIQDGRPAPIPSDLMQLYNQLQQDLSQPEA
jgi:acyl-CoA thioester hydrolase